MNIYVGNLPYGVTDEELAEIFSAHGQVESANVIRDRYSGQSRGFGFVEMPNDEEAQKAIDALNGTEMQGRALNVNKARPRTERRSGGGGGGGGGYGRGDRW